MFVMGNALFVAIEYLPYTCSKIDANVCICCKCYVHLYHCISCINILIIAEAVFTSSLLQMLYLHVYHCRSRFYIFNIAEALLTSLSFQKLFLHHYYF